MPRRPKGSVPALVHHKPSNRARVRINGRDHWLGKWGSPEARLAYERLIAEYLANGRITPPQPTAAPVEVVVQPTRPGVDVKNGYSTTEPQVPATLSVAEVTIMYLDYCQVYYRDPEGNLTSTYGNALQAARALRPFDDTAAATFGPKKLGMIRDAEAAAGRPRVGCNALVKSVRRLFQWAESQELAQDCRAAQEGPHDRPGTAAREAGVRRGRGCDDSVSTRHRRRHGSVPAAHRCSPRRSLRPTANGYRSLWPRLGMAAGTSQEQLERR